MFWRTGLWSTCSAASSPWPMRVWSPSSAQATRVLLPINGTMSTSCILPRWSAKDTKKLNLGRGFWRIPVAQPCHNLWPGYSFAAKALAVNNLDHAMHAVTSKGSPELALNVYDLPSIEQAVHCMHASLGYPVAATWLKACRAVNFTVFFCQHQIHSNTTQRMTRPQ